MILKFLNIMIYKLIKKIHKILVKKDLKNYKNLHVFGINNDHI